MNAPDLSHEKILFLVYGHVADTLAALPGLRLLRNACPQAEIEVLCLRSVAPLLHGSGYAERLVISADCAHKQGRVAKADTEAMLAILSGRLRARRGCGVMVLRRSLRAFRRLATLVGARY